MAAPGPWVLYNDFKLNAFKKLLDMSADSFKVALVTSASNAMDATLTGPCAFSKLTGEVSAVSTGYTAGGASAGTGALTGGAGTATITFDVSDVSWTAGSATLVARAAVLYDDTPGTSATKWLVAYFLLDSTPADVTTANGNTLTISIANVFTDL